MWIDRFYLLDFVAVNDDSVCMLTQKLTNFIENDVKQELLADMIQQRLNDNAALYNLRNDGIDILLSNRNNDLSLNDSDEISITFDASENMVAAVSSSSSSSSPSEATNVLRKDSISSNNNNNNYLHRKKRSSIFSVHSNSSSDGIPAWHNNNNNNSNFNNPVGNVMEIDPAELAQQMTLYECMLFRNIKPQECLNQNWNTGRGDIATNHSNNNNIEEDENGETRWQRQIKLAPNILAMISRFNRMSYFVATTVLNEKSVTKRTKIVRYFLLVMDALLEINNFNGLMEIMTGLQNTAVFRLKKT